jgi:hypothetical protein
MPLALYIIFGAGYTVVCAAGLGKLLLRSLGVRLYRGEDHLLGFVAGAPLLSLLVFLTCTLGFAQKGAFLWIGIAILALAWRRGSHKSAGDPLPPLPRFWKYILLGVFAVFGVLYLANAMAPEWSPDGSSYHLGLVARYLREHRFPRITTNLYANLSQGVEMLFLFAFAFGRHSAAALTHCAFLIALPLLMLCYARRFGIPSAGACGAVLVLASPVAGIDGTSAYVDVATATIAFAVFYFLRIWEDGQDSRLLAPIGLLAGFAYAAKYTGVVVIAYALGFVVWRSWPKRRVLLRSVLMISGGALLMMLPWMLKNWVWLGNPFSPLANALFPNPYVTIGFEHDYTGFLRHYHLRSYWEWPVAVTVRGQLSGVVGPVFLLAPLALLALRVQQGRMLLAAAAVMGLPCLGNIDARFLIPPLPFLSLAMGLVFTQWQRVAPAAALLHALLGWPNVAALYTDPHAWRLTNIPWREALRIRPEDAFLRSKKPDYGMVRLLDTVTPKDARVFVFRPVSEAYTTREVIVGYQSAPGMVMRDALWAAVDPNRQPTWRLRFDFPARPLRRIRVSQTAQGGQGYWSVAEMRVLRGGAEVPRASQWRLRARPNPWYVQLAFDNSPVTCWTSAQTLFSGMYLEMDFGRPESIDAVLLEAPRHHDKIRLRLDGMDAAGRWLQLAAQPQLSDAPLPAGLRHAAIEELKARGVRYMVVFDDEPHAEDFILNSHKWGIRQLAELKHARLYELYGRLGRYVAMNDPNADAYLVDDISRRVEGGAWRRAGQRPRMRFFLEAARHLKLSVDFVIAEASFQQTRPVTLSFIINGRPFDSVRYDRPGDQHYEKPVPESLLRAGQENSVEIESDKVWTSRQDDSKLSIILIRAGFVD